MDDMDDNYMKILKINLGNKKYYELLDMAQSGLARQNGVDDYYAYADKPDEYFKEYIKAEAEAAATRAGFALATHKNIVKLNEAVEAKIREGLRLLGGHGGKKRRKSKRRKSKRRKSKRRKSKNLKRKSKKRKTKRRRTRRR